MKQEMGEGEVRGALAGGLFTSPGGPFIFSGEPFMSTGGPFTFPGAAAEMLLAEGGPKLQSVTKSRLLR